MTIIKLPRYGPPTHHKDILLPPQPGQRAKYACRICGLPANPPFKFYCSERHQHQFNTNVCGQMWPTFRERIIKRDNHQCQHCAQTENLYVHHIKPVKTHPALEYEPENCITLCHQCHQKAHAIPIKYMDNAKITDFWGPEP